jgi:uncharacterized FlaG/YvyC family protein
MNQDDLTCLKHIGIARMKLLNDAGITTIKQLHEIPLETLAEVTSIGEYYAKLIKNAVADYYRCKNEEVAGETKFEEKRRTAKTNRDLHKTIKRLNKRLKRINENLKPLWKKKYLVLYIDFKKRYTTLKVRLSVLDKILDDLPKKKKEAIIKSAETLIFKLKKVGKKPKKKKYKHTIQNIQSFSRSLRDVIS